MLLESLMKKFIDDFSQTEIDLVLKNIDLCVAKKFNTENKELIQNLLQNQYHE